MFLDKKHLQLITLICYYVTSISYQLTQKVTSMTTKDKEKQTQQRLFDIQAEVKKIDDGIKQMLEKQQPGQATGLGTKTLILMQRKDMITKLIGDGWTPHQIANAISSDSFGILPKSITMLVNPPKPKSEKLLATDTATQAKTPAKTRKSRKQQVGNEPTIQTTEKVTSTNDAPDVSTCMFEPTKMDLNSL